MTATRAFGVVGYSDALFYDALSNSRCTAEEVAKKQSARALAAHLGRLKAQYMVVEANYTDRDYLEDYASYYARCFDDYSRKCKRVHFFSCALSDDILNKAIRRELSESEFEVIRSQYLGFVVARPLPVAVVGRTVLATPQIETNGYAFPCTRNYNVNLYGIDLVLANTLAYQEQDTVLAACATVSLWSCLHKTSDLFGSMSPSPSEITRLANQIVHRSRPIPSKGLVAQQICNAIRQVGLEPEVTEVGSQIPLASLIYAYVRGGIPVILGAEIEGLGGHAITVVGYALSKAPSLKSEVGGTATCISMVGRRVEKFFVHDDGVGPFSELMVRPSATASGRVFPITFDGTWRDPKSGAFLRLLPCLSIAPVYHKIRVTFLDVQRVLLPFTRTLEALVSGVELEWDIWLSNTNSFKKELADAKRLDADVRQKILTYQHPRWIWRAVLRANGQDEMEFLGDATDMAKSFHVYGVMWYDEKLRGALKGLMEDPKTLGWVKSRVPSRFVQFLREASTASGCHLRNG